MDTVHGLKTEMKNVEGRVQKTEIRAGAFDMSKSGLSEEERQALGDLWNTVEVNKADIKKAKNVAIMTNSRLERVELDVDTVKTDSQNFQDSTSVHSSEE